MDDFKRQLDNMRQMMNGGGHVLRETIVAAAIEAEHCEAAAEQIDRVNAARERLKRSLQAYESPLSLPRYDEPVHAGPLAARVEDGLDRAINQCEHLSPRAMAERFQPQPIMDTEPAHQPPPFPQAARHGPVPVDNGGPYMYPTPIVRRVHA